MTTASRKAGDRGQPDKGANGNNGVGTDNNYHGSGSTPVARAPRGQVAGSVGGRGGGGPGGVAAAGAAGHVAAARRGLAGGQQARRAGEAGVRTGVQAQPLNGMEAAGPAEHASSK